MSEAKSSLSSSIASSSGLLDKPLSKGKSEVSISIFSYLFNEIILYCQSRIDTSHELESKLSQLGYNIGVKYLELSAYRNSLQLSSSSSSSIYRPKTILQMLQYIHSGLWKQLFGHNADALEKSTTFNDEYYIYDSQPITNKYLSIPRDLGKSNNGQNYRNQRFRFVCLLLTSFIIICCVYTCSTGSLNCAGFIAGIIAGVLDSASFNAQVTAHFTPKQDKTVYIIKFDKNIIKREQQQPNQS